MKREVLFRAYQKNFKRMLPVVGIEFDANGVQVVTVDNRGIDGKYDVIPYYSRYIDGNEDFPLDTLILMQSTGLRDKNGNRIFEGDICEHIDKDNYPRPFAVEWIEDYACFAFVDKGDYSRNYYFQKNHMENIQVVGNIYNNKPLLK